MKLRFDPYFKNLVPPLSEEEFKQLEDNIVAENCCREAILTWKGYIVDGYSRFEICSKHKIPFKISKMNFASREEALIWIAENQLGRRNLSDAARIEIASRRAELLSAKKPIKVRKTIAEAAGVSEQTVYKYMKVIGNADAETIEKLRCGEMKIGTAYGMLKIKNRIVREFYLGSKSYLAITDKLGKIGGIYLTTVMAEEYGKIEWMGKLLGRQLICRS